MNQSIDSGWLQTFTGLRYEPLNPDPSIITFTDIAHSLSMKCRYNGFTAEFYSVAQHCVMMATFCAKDETERRYALLHDSVEAYLLDMPRPIKYQPEMAFWRELEDQWESTIYKRFGLDPEKPAVIKEYDRWMLNEESMVLMAPLHPDWKATQGTGRFLHTHWWTPAFARQRYLELARQLWPSEFSGE